MTTVDQTIGLSDAERVLFRLRIIHRERVEAIQKDQSPVRLQDPTRLIVHLMPEQAVCAAKTFSGGELQGASQSIRPPGERHGYNYGECRFNADGLLLWRGQPARSYVQLFRNGLYEAAMADVVFQNKPEKILRENWCEEALLTAMGGYLSYAKSLGLELPFWMFAALDGCEGSRICLHRQWEELSQYAIDRTIVWLPECKIDAFDADPVTYLRPMIDVLWNAVGLERSFNYDHQGQWKPRR